MYDVLEKPSELIYCESWDIVPIWLDGPLLFKHVSQLDKTYVQSGLKHSLKQYKYC